jgi:outer membrane biosynthesis protein TonB
MTKHLVLLSALAVLWFGGCNQPAGPVASPGDYTPTIEQEEPAEPPSGEPVEPPPPEGEQEPEGEQPPIEPPEEPQGGEPPEPPNPPEGGHVTRTVTVDMYTLTGSGWTGNAALRIVVNGVDIPEAVKVHTAAADNTPPDQLYRSTYTLTVTAGDTVQFFWAAGLAQGDYSFIVYYAESPPIPAFSADQKGAVFWNGTNALLYRTRGFAPAGLYKENDGALLGGFTVNMPDTP